MWMGMVSELHPDVRGVWKNCQMTNCVMPNNISSMKCAQKTVPCLADDGVPHGVGDGSVTLAPGSGSKKWAYHVDQQEKMKGFGG